MKALAPLLAIWALAASAGAETLPRAADGHLDLTGVWSNASLTQLNRAPGAPLVASEAEARARAARAAAGKAADAKPTDPNAGDLGQAPIVAQGYNAFWVDNGDGLARVKGQFRTSWIVEPASGQLPLTDAARRLAREAAAMSGNQSAAGPEALSPNDRCIIASRGSGGPGMLNNVYNSNYQIVQTPGAVAIVVEMIHDARIVPVFPDKAAAQAHHRPAAMSPWLGDSVGWWEGDTLVIETIDVDPRQGRFGPIFLSPQARVTERLTRASASQIFYAFQVEDPVNYTQTWRAEMSLNALGAPLYEFACHEGNYAMRGVLGAARASEAQSRPGASAP